MKGRNGFLAIIGIYAFSLIMIEQFKEHANMVNSTRDENSINIEVSPFWGRTKLSI
jgi:hypothetical protein